MTWTQPSGRQPIAVSDISIYICLIDIRSKSKEQLNERRVGLSNISCIANFYASSHIFTKEINIFLNVQLLFIIIIWITGVLMKECNKIKSLVHIKTIGHTPKQRENVWRPSRPIKTGAELARSLAALKASALVREVDSRCHVVYSVLGGER